MDAGYNDCISKLSESILSTLPAFNYSSSINWLYAFKQPSDVAIDVYITGDRNFNNRSLGYYIGSALSEKSSDFKVLPFVKQMVFLGKRVRDLLITSIVYNDNKDANPSDVNKR